MILSTSQIALCMAKQRRFSSLQWLLQDKKLSKEGTEHVQHLVQQQMGKNILCAKHKASTDVVTLYWKVEQDRYLLMLDYYAQFSNVIS